MSHLICFLARVRKNLGRKKKRERIKHSKSVPQIDVQEEICEICLVCMKTLSRNNYPNYHSIDKTVKKNNKKISEGDVNFTDKTVFEIYFIR